MAELAHAYVSIRASTGGMQGDVRKALTGIESQAGKTGQSMGQKLSSGIGSALKKTAVGVGVAGGAALAAGLTKGIGRLTGIENAEASLRGLGHSASNVEGIMDNALASVKGTSYGLEEAATIAASAVAAGVKPGQDLERTLKLTGDAAAIAGTDLQSMGSIINKVATSDMMQMDVANQMMDAGIPILQLVGQEMGVTAEEARKMASAGKVSFETFQNALESGLGGAALELGNTTAGAFRNMGAAAGRLGATLAGPFFDQASGAFGGITDLLDDLNAKAGPAMEQVAEWLAEAGASASDAFAKFRESEFARTAMADLGNIFASLAGTAAEVWPSLQKIGGALAEASAALGVSAWDAFVVALRAASGVLDALVGPLNVVADVMEAQPGLVTAAVAAWLAFKTVPSIMGKLSGALDKVSDKVKPAGVNVAAFGSAWQDSMTWARQANPEMSKAGTAMLVVGENAKAAARGGMASLKNGVSNLVGALGGPLNVGILAVTGGLAAMAAASQNAKAHQDALRQSSQRLAESQQAVAETLAESNGELNSEVWAELESQIDSTRSSMDQVAGTSMGLWDGMGVGIKASAQLYGALKSQNDGMLESAAATLTNATAQHRSAKDAEAAAEAINKLGLSNEQVAQKVYGSSAAWEGFRAHLVAQGEEGEKAAGILAGLRGEFERQQAALEALPDGAHATAEAIAVIADEASTADQQLSAMRSALQELGLIQTTAEQQAFQYAEAIDDIVDSAAEGVDAAGGLGDALLMEGKLDPAKENARALNDELTALGDEFLNTALKSGDAAGAYEQAGPALQALADKYDLPIGKVRELAGQYGLLPDQVGTIITVANDDVAKKQVQGVLSSLNAVKPGATAQVKIDNQQAMDALRMTGVEIVNYDAKSGTADVRVDNEQALDGVNDAWGQVDGFDAEVATADVRVDNSQAKAGINESKSWLDSIPIVKETRVVFRAIYEGFRNLVGGGEQHGGAWNGARSLPAFARGGHNGYRLPTSGPGTEVTDGFIAFNSDNVPAARLDAGEWIINGRSSEKYNRELAAINAGVFPKLPGYAEGGRADAKDLLEFVHGRGGHGQSRSLEGAPYVFAGINWGDCSAAMAAIARFAVGLAPFAERFSTGNMRQALLGMGAKLGRGSAGDLRFGWMHGGPGGGHTSGTLPDGTNVEMGGARGNGQIGGGAAPATHPQYTEHAYIPIHTWAFDRVEGLEGLMPPGASTTWSGMSGISGGTTTPGLYASPGNSGQVAENQPRTWSDMAAGATAALVGGQVEDALGVFGVPNQLPPIVQAWQMLNEKPGGGPSDWDLSTAAAEVKRLDAAVQIRERITTEAAKVLDTMRNSPAGDPLQSQMVAAEAELDKAILDLERDRMAQEEAQSRLKDLVGARAAAIATKDSASGSDLASAALGGPPDVRFTDELMREIKLAYDPAGGAEQWRPMVVAALKRNGFAATQREQDLMIAQIQSESGGNPSIAQQIHDMNGTGEAAGVGLLQIIPGTFAAHRDPSLPDDRRDPWANMNAALRYYKSRYGMDLGQMWGKGHGYNAGGWISGFGSKDSVPLVGAPGEFIVNRKAAAQNRDMLEAMNSGQPVAPAGQGVTYNIYAFDLDEAMARTSRREAQHAQTYMGAR